MKVDKLRRLFDALDTSAQRNQQQQQPSQQVDASRAENSEAVRLASNLRGDGLEVVDTRQRKLDALKAQIEDGSYNPPTRAVAEKFLLEIA